MTGGTRALTIKRDQGRKNTLANLDIVNGCAALSKTHNSSQLHSEFWFSEFMIFIDVLEVQAAQEKQRQVNGPLAKAEPAEKRGAARGSFEGSTKIPVRSWRSS